MAINHTPFDAQKNPSSDPNFGKGAGYTERCAECGHFYEEHVHPRTFCRCCNAGPEPLPSATPGSGNAFGFRRRGDHVEGAAGLVQGAEFPKHLHKYGSDGAVVSTIVLTPEAEAKAAAAGFKGSVKELGPNPVAKARVHGSLEQRMARLQEIEEILSDKGAGDSVETLQLVIAQRNEYAQKLADIKATEK